MLPIAPVMPPDIRPAELSSLLLGDFSPTGRAAFTGNAAGYAM